MKKQSRSKKKQTRPTPPNSRVRSAGGSRSNKTAKLVAPAKTEVKPAVNAYVPPAKTIAMVVGPLDAGRRLDQFIAARSGDDGFSRNTVKKMILEGSVALNGELCADADRSMKEGDQVEIRAERAPKVRMLGEKIAFGVVFEDDDLLVVNKPAGLVVHPGAGNQHGTLVNALIGSRRKLSDVGGGDRPGIVHRLDKDTSGLLVVAKTNRAHRALTKAFSSREVHKEYSAIVQGVIDRMEGRVDRPVGRDPVQRVKMTALNPQHPREAITHYTVDEKFRHSTLVTLRPVTGRTHQIRVHMAFMGHPVAGDPVYGTADGQRLALHARKISFDHPVTRRTLEFEAPLPEDFKKRLKQEREK
jgi:23S rRNA pseudouridine1911/1915/1917 synthase